MRCEGLLYPLPHIPLKTAFATPVGGNANFSVQVGGNAHFSVFRYQHVGISNFALGVMSNATSNARSFALQWNIGFRSPTLDLNIPPTSLSMYVERRRRMGM